MLWRALFLVIAMGAASAQAQDFLVKPDPEMTSGDFCDEHDRDFRGYRYAERIAYCERNVSHELKARIYEAYGIPPRCRGEYTIDHFVPLSMGGSNQQLNLWPEHRNVKATRQDLEQDTFDQLRKGMISREDAVSIILEAKTNPPHGIPAGCH